MCHWPLLLVALAETVLLTSSGRAQQAKPAGPAPGQLVDIGGHKLHLHCLGTGNSGPTVILEAGGGGFSTSWSAVQNLLQSRVRVCAYDRAGLGWSESGPAPRTLRQEVFELHQLLQTAKIRGPLVLVGQSIGGLLVRLYSEKYPRDVAGVVLVDPTHEDSVLFSLKVNRWVRLRDLAAGRTVPEPRLKRDSGAPPDADTDYLPDEFQLMHLSRKAKPQPLGGRPLIVLGAGRRPAPPGTPDEVWVNLRREKDEQVRDLTRLSRNSKFVLARDSGHNIHTEDPQLVAQAVEEVVEAAAAGDALIR